VVFLISLEPKQAMSQPAHMISFHTTSGMQLLHIEPPDQHQWLIHFVESCSFRARCDDVLLGLETAIAGGSPAWRYTINEIEISYHNEKKIVTAVFLFDNPPSESSMDSGDFLRILREWRDVLTK
jgi:hypothetical protein